MALTKSEIKLRDLQKKLAELEQKTLGKTNPLDGTNTPPENVPNARLVSYLIELIAEYTKRIAQDGLSMYRPLPGPASDFHECRKKIRILCGANQSGKTQTSEAEVARIGRGMDPFKKRKPRDLIIMCVAKNEMHIAAPMFRKLWWPGAFDMIRDKQSGLWRSVLPDPKDHTKILPEDFERQEEWLPAPPLIPMSEIRELAWAKKNMAVPKRLLLVNGTEILFHTSEGFPRAGIEVDLVHFDEEISNSMWYSESQARLLKRNGLFIWSATPQASTPQFYDLHRLVERGAEHVAEFNLLIDDNPYIPAESKKAFFDSLALYPDELAVRYYGRYAILDRKVYPAYNLDLQGVDAFEPPDEWMRVLIFDPGTSASGCLFMAIPPLADELHAYGEVFCKNSTAEELMAKVAERLGHRQSTDGKKVRHVCEVFVIDKKAGMQTPMGYTNRVADEYAKSLKPLGLRSRLSGNHFEYGSDLVEGRELSLKRRLADGTLKFHRGALPYLDRQMQNRYYEKNRASNKNKREARTEHELVDTLEYGNAYFDKTGLYYHRPLFDEADEMGIDLSVWQAFQDEKAKEQKKHGRQGVNLS